LFLTLFLWPAAPLPPHDGFLFFPGRRCPPPGERDIPRAAQFLNSLPPYINYANHHIFLLFADGPPPCVVRIAPPIFPLILESRSPSFCVPGLLPSVSSLFFRFFSPPLPFFDLFLSAPFRTTICFLANGLSGPFPISPSFIFDVWDKTYFILLTPSVLCPGSVWPRLQPPHKHLSFVSPNYPPFLLWVSYPIFV